jgi:uncharacterized damage-inducible protein DinB
LPGIPALLQPAAHAFLLAEEDTTAALAGLSEEQLWRSPGGVASLGFHLAHLAGSTDRLLSYARGEQLSEAQRGALAREQALAGQQPRPSAAELLGAWRATVAGALRQLAATPEAGLTEPRRVGRAGLPSTVLGILFHAAEHAARHTGQVVTTARLVRAS